MSLIKREWLLHGCMKLDEFEEKDRISLRIRDILANDYGEKFAVRSWPQQNYRDTLWWYEKSKLPSTVASYFLKIDNRRGPNLYVGVSVEKGIEDLKLAQKRAKAKSERLERWKLQRNWDWHRFLSSLNQTWPLIFACGKSLNRELYFWIEFDEGRTDSRYYVISDNSIYWRGGFKPVKQEKIYKFLTKAYPKSWGDVYLARAFNLNDCSPQLDETKILDVFTAMRPIRDLWRGLSLK
ncbi:MAG: hypothetical protein ABSH06_22900 [Thermodesulfobacteriota bacterium]